MSYLISKINPLDLVPSKGIGISIPFNGNVGLNTTYTSKDTIRTNLLNFLLTNRRERILNPNFGSTIREQIFEQISNGTFEDIENIIYSGVQSYFPTVKINELSVTDSGNNQITIYFSYSIENTNIDDDIQINFNNV